MTVLVTVTLLCLEGEKPLEAVDAADMRDWLQS